MRTRSNLAAVLIGACFSVGYSSSQDSSEYAKMTPKERQQKYQELVREHEPSVYTKAESIRKELQILDREALPDDNWAKHWAGTYYVGDGLGMNVSILLAPENGISYTWRGCLGLYDMNYGSIVEVFPDGLRLELAIDPDLEVRPFFDDRLYFVKWGSNRFLIPECKMMEFVNDFNAGGSSREFMGSSPQLDGRNTLVAQNEPRAGVPHLPAKWAKLLILEPYQISMTFIEPLEPQHVTGDVWRHSYKVAFDKGSDKGVFEGMEFKYQEGHAYGTITIEHVEADSCTGALICFEGKEPPVHLPKVGYEFKLPAERPSWALEIEK